MTAINKTELYSLSTEKTLVVSGGISTSEQNKQKPQEVEETSVKEERTWQKTGILIARDSAIHIAGTATIEATGSVLELTAAAFTMKAVSNTVGLYAEDHVSRACGKLIKKESEVVTKGLYNGKSNCVSEYVGTQIGKAAGASLGKIVAKTSNSIIPKPYAIMLTAIPAAHIASKGATSKTAVLIISEISSRVAMNAAKGLVQSTTQNIATQYMGKVIGTLAGAIVGEVTGMIAGKIAKEGVKTLLSSQEEQVDLSRDIYKKLPMSLLEGAGIGTFTIIGELTSSIREDGLLMGMVKVII